MSELPVDETLRVAGAARDAAGGAGGLPDHARGAVAGIVPAKFAEALEGMSEQDTRDLLEDLADAAAVRRALAEPVASWRASAFLALDKPVRCRVGVAVDALAEDPRPLGAKMITGAQWRAADQGRRLPGALHPR